MNIIDFQTLVSYSGKINNKQHNTTNLKQSRLRPLVQYVFWKPSRLATPRWWLIRMANQKFNFNISGSISTSDCSTSTLAQQWWIIFDYVQLCYDIIHRVFIIRVSFCTAGAKKGNNMHQPSLLTKTVGSFLWTLGSFRWKTIHVATLGSFQFSFLVGRITSVVIGGDRWKSHSSVALLAQA